MVHLQSGDRLLSVSEDALQWWVDGEHWQGTFAWQCLFNTWLLIRLTQKSTHGKKQTLYFCFYRRQLTPALWCQLRRCLECRL
ncbi:hypothetical protein [Idiomarina fontislapidosi]|uniref:Uncharacterized protein n=1 Tax=Idiomarina fontislapidosi TaxID=263723 RepID=A0A432YBQ2_9GAMM|nr:hypothetical protein [Idiomarina fontislapidosi]RUO58363.1 hypothetical protein CWE25_01865 [Idiomarina fontislapidosi]